MDRWSLPGPAGFISEVTSALRDGSNVVVGVPPGIAELLAQALDDRISSDGWPLFRFLPPSDNSPIDEIHAQLECPDGLSSTRSIASLMASFDRKRVVVVPDVGGARWPSWLQFIEEYASACRSIGAFDRTQFLILAAGVAKNRLPSRAPALQTMIWDGWVGEADVFSYVVHSWRSTGRRVDARAKLTARVITKLALWDFDLVDQLLDLDLRDLFRPQEALAAIDDREGRWNGMGEKWEEGGIAEFDGEQCIHSLALCRSQDPKSELRMRLWAAQAAELLPALELKRRHLAERMKATRSVPSSVRLNDEIVQDLNDIEIGGLLHLARVYRLPPDIVATAEKCRALRNKLAHLVPLTPDEALEVISR